LRKRTAESQGGLQAGYVQKMEARSQCSIT
jgi:hypothetical protein